MAHEKPEKTEKEEKQQSEAVKRILSILTTIEQKNEDVHKASCSINSLHLVREQAEKALRNARIQLAAELKKFDSDLGDLIKRAAEVEPVHA